ncbi:uncharacterized protein LOC109820707 [Asparagus officinalis]|uniref:uncharacterized protein LOC109820707 n=1 Tax=Asparagus officinalis TaxID=4686 RepID=UPI00098E197E|nr:uncharacterized protein LOC109820707 [Asparagus officinalis]
MLDALSQWASSISPPQVEFSSDIPRWLDKLLKEEFFDPCGNHLGSKQNEKNIFCLDCSLSICSNCSSRHFGHRVLQIRKYNEHRVVKIEDMGKLLICSLVQSYMLNRAQVVFLKARSANKKKDKAQNEQQTNKKRGRAQNQHTQNSDKICSSCPRALKEDFEYCSVVCMVKKVLETEGSIKKYLRPFLPLPLNLEEFNGELVPSELVLRDPSASGSNGARRAECKKKRKNNDVETSPSPCALVQSHRRKSIPRRAPFF